MTPRGWYVVIGREVGDGTDGYAGAFQYAQVVRAESTEAAAAEVASMFGFEGGEGPVFAAAEITLEQAGALGIAGPEDVARHLNVGLPKVIRP